MDTSRDIVKSQLQVFSTLGQMAEDGALVGDLVRGATRHCLISLLATGIEPAEARNLFVTYVREISSTVAPDRIKMFKIFDSAIAHAEYLTLIEENKAY